MDFTNAAKQNKMTAGCSLLEEEDEQMEDERDAVEDDDDESNESDPCANNNCKSGSTCVPKPLGSYACKCQSGWTGKYCETGKTNIVYFVSWFKQFSINS